MFLKAQKAIICVEKNYFLWVKSRKWLDYTQDKDFYILKNKKCKLSNGCSHEDLGKDLVFPKWQQPPRYVAVMFIKKFWNWIRCHVCFRCTYFLGILRGRLARLLLLLEELIKEATLSQLPLKALLVRQTYKITKMPSC